MRWSSGDRDNIEDRRGSSGMRTAVPIGIGGLLVLGLLSWVTGEAAVPENYDTELFRKLKAFHHHDKPIHV